MRELVYLSTRKLVEDFGHRPRGLIGWIKDVKGTLKLRDAAELTVDAAPPVGPRRQRLLRKADASIKGLRKQGRAAVPITEEVQPGQWVRFSAPMSYTAIDNAAVFLDVRKASESYPTGGTIRILLHGTARHMVGDGQVPHTSVEELSEQASEQFASDFISPLHPDCWASPINNFMRIIEWGAKDSPDRLEGTGMPFSRQISAASLPKMVPLVERRLNLPHTAVWVGGYARVTAVVPRRNRRKIVFATPLYVEHVAPPPAP